ncbi:MAG: M20/M25/M40 family metallo-hydrolase, partial [Cyclobacteriaceae bacterium]
VKCSRYIRSALDPKFIDKAASFIEQEFKKIGLKPLTGLKGFQQEFKKEKVIPLTASVIIDGETIPYENFIVISEKKELEIDGDIVVKTIPFDSKASDKGRHYFRRQAFKLIRDTVPALVLVAQEYEKEFALLKNRFGQRFVGGKVVNTIFVLGKKSATKFKVRATQKLEIVTLRNIVGVLEGTTKKEEYVVFGAHYDHVGILKKKIKGDSIANGADDDASGVAAVITLARYYKKIKNNNRTLIFVAFTAEEVGGFGSQHFSKQLNPDKVITMFNIEMIGKPSKWGLNNAFVTGYERSDFGKILQNNLKGTQYHFWPDPYPEYNLFYRSDNATLARLGVPAHSISTNQIDNDKFYHTVDDEVESLDFKNITTTIKAIAISGKSIIDGIDTPKRIDKSKVY